MMFRLSKEDWDTIYNEYKGEIDDEIIKRKKDLNEYTRSDIYKQDAYNALNALYIHRVTLDNVNEHVQSKMTENASTDDEQILSRNHVQEKIQELREELVAEQKGTRKKIKEWCNELYPWESLKTLTVHDYEVGYGISILEELERLISEK